MIEAWKVTASSETDWELMIWYTLSDRGGTPTDLEQWFGVVGPASEGFVPKSVYPVISKIKLGT